MLTQIETTKGKLDFYKYEECYEVFDATDDKGWLADYCGKLENLDELNAFLKKIKMGQFKSVVYSV